MIDKAKNHRDAARAIERARAQAVAPPLAHDPAPNLRQQRDMLLRALREVTGTKDPYRLQRRIRAARALVGRLDH